MNFTEATESFFRKYADFSSRSSRSEYWYAYLFIAMAGLGIGFLEGFMGLFPQSNQSILIIPFQIGVLIPSFAILARRLHDINKSGWWIFFPATTVIFFILGFLIALAINSLFIGIAILFVGFIPLIIFIYWTALKSGDLESNRFGPPSN